MMKWLTQYFRPAQTFSNQPDMSLNGLLAKLNHDLYGGGVAVTPQSVLGFPPFYRAVCLVAARVAELPIKVFDRATRAVDETHPGGLAINQPHPLYGPFALIRTWVKDLFLYGNGYGVILRDPMTFEPVGIEYLDPYSMTFDRKNQSYKYNETKYSPEHIVHIKGIGDVYGGDDPLRTHNESLSLGLSMQRYGKSWFNSHIGAEVLLTMQGMFKDAEQRKEYQASMDEQYAGVKNAGKWAMLPGNPTITQLNPISNETAQWTQGREHEAIQASNIVGVPPHMTGSKISSSYNSFEAENKRFLSDIEPYLRAIEEECTLKLLTESEKRKKTKYFSFVRASLLQADKKTEIELLIAQKAAGILTLNQVLGMMNLPTIGPDGDTRQSGLPANPPNAPQTPQNAPQSTPNQGNAQ